MDQLQPYSFAAGSRPSHSGLCSLLHALSELDPPLSLGLGGLDTNDLCLMRLVRGDARIEEPSVAWSLLELRPLYGGESRLSSSGFALRGPHHHLVLAG